jgi:sulfur carrier protein
MASAVDKPQETSSASSGFAVGIGASILSAMFDKASMNRGRLARAYRVFRSRYRIGDALSSGDMQVTINGAAREVPEPLTVRALIEHLGLGGGPVAVEINRAIVPRASHATREVKSGDVIEIVHFVGGG